MKLADLPIAQKVWVGFGFMCLGVLSIGLYSWNSLSTLGSEWNRYRTVTLVRGEAVARASVYAGNSVHMLKNYLLRGEDYQEKFTKEMDNLEGVIGRYREMAQVTPEESAIIDEMAAHIRDYRAAMKTAVDMKASGAGSADIDKAIMGKDSPLLPTLQKLADINHQRFNEQTNVITSLANTSTGVVLIVIAIFVIIGCLITYALGRSIVGPLTEAVGIATTVAAGDLRSKIESRTRDETGWLMHELKNMNKGLAKLVSEMRAVADMVSVAAKEIAAGHADLSSRTEEQASALEQTASTMEELTSTVKQNAENAKQANKLAMGASEVVTKGGEVVSRVVDTMGSINESAKKIVDIISVIDGIAFQTNILALNAAVEAARAGEQGRGFAVVASEVRNLAQRSAAAAKEIKTLISDSVDKVQSGTKQVDEAGRTMQEIVASIRQVSDIVAEIAAASAQQSSGIEQVNQTVLQMDKVTQQNAALVEEASTAAESLEEQAHRLAETVSSFKLSADAETQLTEMKKAMLTSHKVAIGSGAGTNVPVLANRHPVKTRARADTEEWKEF